MTSYELIEQYVEEGRWREAAGEAWHVSRRSASRAKSDGWAKTAREYAIKAGYPVEAVDAAIRRGDLYPLLMDEPQYSIVIVTRHAGAVKWLRQHGYIGEVLDHVDDPAQVRGKIIVGALPQHLAAVALELWTIDMPRLSQEQRGKDLSPEEMDAAGAQLHRYKVIDLGLKK
jgi:putative CRISPR-associated protein (TIGR02620 family)